MIQCGHCARPLIYFPWSSFPSRHDRAQLRSCFGEMQNRQIQARVRRLRLSSANADIALRRGFSIGAPHLFALSRQIQSVWMTRPNCPRRPAPTVRMFRIQRYTDRRYCISCIRMCADRNPACLARCERASFSRHTSCMVPPSGDHGIRWGLGEKRA